MPKWNLAVGSLWFDMSGGQLVRAAYRMSVPMDIKAVAEEDDPKSFEDVPRVMKPLIFPMKVEISAIGVEYGLYQGRFWLPRVQVARGRRADGLRARPFKLEQKFSYEHVNAGEPLAPIACDRQREEAACGIGVPFAARVADSARDARRNRRRRATRRRIASTRGEWETTTRIPCSSPSPAIRRGSPTLPTAAIHLRQG